MRLLHFRLVAFSSGHAPPNPPLHCPQMPKMDGLQATEAIRRSDHRTPIVGVSASVQADDVSKCIVAGMTDFLGKPFTRMQLEQLVRRFAVPTHASSARVRSRKSLLQRRGGRRASRSSANSAGASSGGGGDSVEHSASPVPRDGAGADPARLVSVLSGSSMASHGSGSADDTPTTTTTTTSTTSSGSGDHSGSAAGQKPRHSRGGVRSARPRPRPANSVKARPRPRGKRG